MPNTINFADIWGKIVAFWTESVGAAETYLEGILKFDITPEFLLLTDVCLVVLIGFIILCVTTWRKFF